MGNDDFSRRYLGARSVYTYAEKHVGYVQTCADLVGTSAKGIDAKIHLKNAFCADLQTFFYKSL